MSRSRVPARARGENSPLHGYWAVFDHLGKYWFSKNKPMDRLPICDRAIREDCPHPIRVAEARGPSLGAPKNGLWLIGRNGRIPLHRAA